MERIAVFPGSFDPITRGHESVILRAVPLFDKIIVAVGINAEKKSFFTLEQRLEWLKQVFRNEPRISIMQYEGLTIDFCREVNAKFLLRGLRTSADFEFERSIGQINKQMEPDIETVFLLTAPEYTALTSSIVRDIVRNGGDPAPFVPVVISIGKL
jgi:pantetheine-phosphate adenylyltransferase